MAMSCTLCALGVADSWWPGLTPGATASAAVPVSTWPSPSPLNSPWTSSEPQAWVA